MDGGVGAWINSQLKLEDRRVQIRLDVFDSRMTRQLRNKYRPDVTEIKTEIAENKKMVHELYDRLIFLELVVGTMMPTVYVPNVWAIQELRIQETKEERIKRKRKNKKYLVVQNKAFTKSSQDEWDLETRVYEMAMGVGGSRALIVDVAGLMLCPPSTIDSTSIDVMVADESGA